MLGPRWTPGRKAEVCRQVLAGEVSAADALARHQLGVDELNDWLELYRRHGVRGLSVRRRPRCG